MELWGLLSDIVFLLTACLLGGGLASRMGQSPLVGYLLARMFRVGTTGEVDLAGSSHQTDVVVIGFGPAGEEANRSCFFASYKCIWANLLDHCNQTRCHFARYTVARSGAGGMIIGNTAERVLNRMNCSVLALKPDGFVSPVKAA